MRMRNKIKERLVKINGFLESNKKPTFKPIHAFRLEVKHVEAFLELMTLQNNLCARSEIHHRLEKLFHEAGKLRKFGLEIRSIQSVINHNRLSKPSLFLLQLGFSKKKSSQKLRKICKACPAFKLSDFVKHPGVQLSADTYQRFLATSASAILDLLKQNILSDIRSLHQLRKILKSILYVLPVCNKGVKPVRVFLKTRKRFIQSVESKIGSMHDTRFFLTRLEKKYNLIQAPEQVVLKKIKREWQHDMTGMKKDLKPLLPTVRQFALDLKVQSTGDLDIAKRVSS